MEKPEGWDQMTPVEKRKHIPVEMGEWNFDEVVKLMSIVQQSPTIKVSDDEFIKINEKLMSAAESADVPI